MSDKTALLEFKGKADQLISETDRAKASVKGLGDTAKTVTGDVGKIGDGGAAASQKLDTATRSMIGSIQRTTAAMEAGSKSGSDYFKALASQRGIDQGALKPYLDQLDAVNAKTLAAGTSNTNLANTFGVLHSGVVKLAAAFGVGFGIHAFTSFIEGGIKSQATLKELSLQTGITVETLSGLRKVANESGIGLDAAAGMVNKLEKNMLSFAQNGGGKAALAFQQLGYSQAEVKKGLQDIDTFLPEFARRLMQAGVGGEQAGLAMQLMAKGGAAALPFLERMVETGKLNATVTTEQAEAAHAFEVQLVQLKASSGALGRSIANELLPSLSAIAEKMLDARKAGDGFFASLNAGIWAIEGEMAKIMPSMFESTNSQMKRQISGLQGELNNLKSKYDFTTIFDPFKNHDKIKVEMDRVTAELDKVNESYRSFLGLTGGGDKGGSAFIAPKPLQTPPGEDPYSKVQDAADKYIATLAKEADQLGMTEKQKAIYNATSESMLLNAGKERESFMAVAKALIDKTSAYKDATEATKKMDAATIKASESHSKYLTSLESETDAINKEAQNVRDQAAAIGQNKGAIDDLKASELERQATTLEGIAIRQLDKNLDEAQYNDLMGLAKAKRDLAAADRLLATNTDNYAAEKKAAQEAAAEWKKGWQETDRIAEQAFNSWVDGGKSMAQAIGDALRKELSNALYATFIRPYLLQVYTSVMGSSPAGSAIGAAGSSLSAASGLSTASNYLGLTGPGSFASGWAASAAASTTATAGEMGLLTGSMDLAAGSAVTATTAMEGFGVAAQGMWAAIPVVGQILLGVAALYAIFGGDHGTPTQNTGNATTSFNPLGASIGQVTREGGTSPQTDADINSMEAAYLAWAHALGITAVAASFAFGGNTGKDSQDPGFAVQGQAGNSVYNTGEPVKWTDANLQLEASRAIFTALQGSDLPKYLKGVFDGFDASKMSQQQITDTETLAQSYADLHTQLQALPFAALKDMSYSTAAALVAASGGMQQLGTNLGTFYSKFYSAAEQAAQTNTNIAAGMTGAGHATSAADVAGMTRDEWRALVETSMTDTSASGIKFTAVLLGVSGAFDSTHAAAAAYAAAMKSAGDKMTSDAASLAADLMRAQGNQRGGDLLAMGITDPNKDAATKAVVAQYDANQAIRDTIKALNDYSAAMASAGSTAASLAVQLLQAGGDSAGATALQRTQELSAATAGLTVEQASAVTATMNANYATADQIVQLTAYTSAMKSASDNAASLAVQLLQAQGNDAGATALQRTQELSAATAGLTAEQASAVTATMNANYATEDQITKLTAYTAAMNSAGQTAASLAVQLLQAQGNDAGATALQRTQELTAATAGLNETQAAAVTAVMNTNYATQDQITAELAHQQTLKTNASLQDQLDVLLGTRTQQQVDRTNILAGMTDATTISLQKQVWAQKDLAASTEAAAAAYAKRNISVGDVIDTAESAVDKMIAQVAGSIKNLSGGDYGKELSNTITYVQGQIASLNAQADRMIKNQGGHSYGNTDQVLSYEATFASQKVQQLIKDLGDYTTLEAANPGHGQALLDLQHWYKQQQSLLSGNSAAMSVINADYAAQQLAIINGTTAAASTVDTVLQGLTSTNASLTDQYNKLTMSEADYRNFQIVGMTAVQVAMYDNNAALQANIDAYNATTAAAAATTSQRKGLQDQLDQLTMSSAQLLDKQRSALDGSNQALFDQVQAAQLAKTEIDRLASSMASLHQNSATLGVALLRAQGNTTGADAAQHTIDVAGMTAAEAAIYDYNKSIQTQIDTLNAAATAAANVASERKGLQDQLNALTDTAAQALARQRDALDASNQGLFDQIQAATALKDANALAAQSALDAAAATKALAETNKTWQDQLDVLTGAQTERSIALRDAGDDTTRALMQQVYAQTDLKTATDAAAAAAATAAQDEVARLAAITNERTGLQNQLDQLTMTSAQLLDKQRAALDGSNQALFDQIQAAAAAKQAQTDLAAATKAAADAVVAAAAAMVQRVISSLASLSDTKLGLQSQLLTAQGDPNGALALTRSNALAKLIDGMSATDAASITAAYGYNTALEDQITALNAAKTAADAAAAAQTQAAQAAQSAAEALAATNKGWQNQLDILTGAQTERSIALRDATDASTISLMQQVYAQQDLKAAADAAAQAAATAAQAEVSRLAAVASERKGLQDQLDQLTMTSAQLLTKQRDALDASNRGLFDQVQAATADKKAAEELASSTAALAAANKGWQDQLDVLTGAQTNRSIALRDATDDSTRALMRQVYAQQDLVEAAAKAIDAMKKISDEMKQVSAFKSTVGDSIHNIQSQMTGYNPVAYQAGQIAKYTTAMSAATDTQGRIDAGGNLKDAIVAKYDAELSAINKTRDAGVAAQQASFDAQTQGTNAAISSQNALNAAYRQIGDYAKGLLTGANSPFSGKELQTALTASYKQLLAGSKAGDINALGKLTGAADTMLANAKTQAVDSVDYARTFGRTLNDLSILGGKAGTDLESVQRTFYADSSIYDAQALALQTSTITSLQDLSALTDVWQQDLKATLSEQAIAYTTMGLTNEQIAVNTSAIGPGFESVTAAINSAQDAKAAQAALLAEIKALNARVDQLVASGNKTAQNTKETAATLDTATGGGGPILFQQA